MKTRIVMIIMVVALFALPTIAQQQEWQSTSAMQTSGSTYTPQVNAVGATTVGEMAFTTESSSPAKAPSGPRRAKMGDFENSTEGGEGDEGSPIGDAMVPLLLMSFVFCGVIALRRKRNPLNR